MNERNGKNLKNGTQRKVNKCWVKSKKEKKQTKTKWDKEIIGKNKTDEKKEREKKRKAKYNDKRKERIEKKKEKLRQKRKESKKESKKRMRKIKIKGRK